MKEQPYKFDPKTLYLVYCCGNVYTVYPDAEEDQGQWFTMPFGKLKCSSASCVEFSEAMKVLQRGDAGDKVTLTIL
jgi:hypothetical protein